jgi:hypothetical protein
MPTFDERKGFNINAPQASQSTIFLGSPDQANMGTPVYGALTGSSVLNCKFVD